MAIVFDAQGNLVDTEGRINFSSEGSDVLPPNPFLSPDTADSPYANLLGLPATQDMGYLLGVPETSNAGYLIGTSGTADDVFPFEPPGTADDRIANLIGVSGTTDDVFPFAPKNRLGGLDLNRFEGIGTLGVANEEDVEQVDYLSNKPKKFQKGIGELFEFFQRFSPIAAISRGIGSFFNPKASDRYRAASQGILGYTPAELNRMNALGGYYSEPAIAQRRAEKRLADLIKRRDEGKSFSQKNLDALTSSLEGAASQAQFATQKAAAKSPKVGVSGFTARDDIRESRRGKF